MCRLLVPTTLPPASFSYFGTPVSSYFEKQNENT